MNLNDQRLNEYKVAFIKQDDFEKHVEETIKSYNETLKSINLDKFNSNVIDPIKLTFDKFLFNKTWNEVIEQEIQRQRDKSNTNAIGYFHQNMFRFIDNCIVPEKGFDVILNKDGKSIYVEMKNKHNTMNSSSSQKTYINMQNHILNNPDDECWLVEVIAPKSRNDVWGISVDGSHYSDPRIRRVSIDEFYKAATGIEDAFYQICVQLPITIEKLVSKKIVDVAEKDTVISELKNKNPDLLKSIYLLAFESYLGFKCGMNDVLKVVKNYNDFINEK